MGPLELHSLKEFLLGAIVMGDVVAAGFFLRYWKVTADRFFLFFAASFVLGAASRVMLAIDVANSESEPLIFVIRLVSYMVIVAGILDKNRTAVKALFHRS